MGDNALLKTGYATVLTISIEPIEEAIKSLGFLKRDVARLDFILPDDGSTPFIFAHFGETPVSEKVGAA